MLNIFLISLLVTLSVFLTLQFGTTWLDVYPLLASVLLILVMVSAIASWWTARVMTNSGLTRQVSAIICWGLVVILAGPLFGSISAYLQLAIYSTPHSTVELHTSDGERIHLIHIAHGNPGVVIIAHGILGHANSSTIVWLAEQLATEFDVIALSFRGCGLSGGWLSLGETEVEDLRIAIEYARHLGYQHVSVVGESLGGMSAITEAVRYENVDSLVLISTPLGFDHLDFPYDLALRYGLANPIGRAYYRMVAHVRLSPSPISLFQYNINSLPAVPILFIVGAEDPYIKIPRLQSALAPVPEPKNLIILKGAGHGIGRLRQQDEQKFTTAIRSYLLQMLK